MIWSKVIVRRKGRLNSQKNCEQSKKVHKKDKSKIPATTVGHVVQKRLQMRPFKLQILQALKADGKRLRQQFCVGMEQQMEEDQFDEKLVFSDEATFHTSGKVNKQNVQIWALKILMIHLSR